LGIYSLILPCERFLVKKFRAISLAVILGLTISSVPAVAVPKPTLAEIEAAKKLEAEKENCRCSG
jgi:hypothetical protein